MQMATPGGSKGRGDYLMDWGCLRRGWGLQGGWIQSWHTVIWSGSDSQSHLIVPTQFLRCSLCHAASFNWRHLLHITNHGPPAAENSWKTAIACFPQLSTSEGARLFRRVVLNCYFKGGSTLQTCGCWGADFVACARRSCGQLHAELAVAGRRGLCLLEALTLTLLDSSNVFLAARAVFLRPFFPLSFSPVEAEFGAD